MQKTLSHIKSKGKIIIMPVAILLVLISIFVFNSIQKNDSAIVYAGNGTYIEASGTVESNLVSLSSEVTGTIVEITAKEGDTVKAGQPLAEIKNTNLKNQYDQALINFQISEKNIELIQNNINNLNLQNVSLVQQAQNAYFAAEAEYEKVMDGASPDEIKQAEEAVSQAETNLNYMGTNLDRSKDLLEQEAISQSKYDEVLKSYDVAKAQYSSALSQLNIVKSYPTDSSAKAAENKMLQAKAGYELSVSNGNTQLNQLESQLEIAKLQFEQSKNILNQCKIELEKTLVKSPIEGVINLFLTNKGEFVSTGKLLAEIYDPNNVEVKAYVSELNIGHIKVGQESELFVDSNMSKAFKGKVTRINDEAEFTPKNIQTKEERVNTVFEITIEVLDSEGVIKPGMPIDVKIKID